MEGHYRGKCDQVHRLAVSSGNSILWLISYGDSARARAISVLVPRRFVVSPTDSADGLTPTRPGTMLWTPQKEPSHECSRTRSSDGSGRSSAHGFQWHAFDRHFALLLTAIVLAAICASPVATKSGSQTGYSNTGAVTTADQAIDHIISREHEELTVLRRYSPIVETYVQDMKPDVEMGIMPVSDHYFLSQADLSKGPTEDSMLDRKLKSKAEQSRVEKSAPYVPRDFLKMVYIDPDGFDRQHYEFRYVGRESLGEVRCVVF